MWGWAAGGSSGGLDWYSGMRMIVVMVVVGVVGLAVDGVALIY